jgi:hydrogenase maturation protease
LREWLHCSVLDGFNRDNIQIALKERATQYNSPMTGLLVIGYGNTLRKDDGVGPAVAETVAALDLPGVEVLSCPLLTPELASPISDARVVLFVDAAVDAPREVRLRRLAAAESTQVMAHAADPRTLLALSRELFGQTPEAWWLTIPVEDLAFGEGFSPLAQRGMEIALDEVKRLASSDGSAG